MEQSSRVKASEEADFRFFRKPAWKLSEAFIWFFVAQGTAILGAVIALSVADAQDLDIESATPIWFLIASSLGLWLGYGGGSLFEAAKKGQGIDAELGLKATPLQYLFGAVIGVFTQLAVLPVVYWPILKLNPEADVGAAARDLVAEYDTPLEIGLFFLVAVVAAPVVEELFYRGLALRAATHHMNVWLAAVITSLVFAAVHLQQLQLPGLFVFGLIAAAVAIYTGKVGISIAMHMAFNLTTVIMLFWL